MYTGETDGKEPLSELATHQLSSGIGLTLEPPLSTPIVLSSGAIMSEPSPEPEISSTQPLRLSAADALAPLMAPRPAEPETDIDLAEILPVMAREPEPEPEPLDSAAADFPLDFSLRDPVPASSPSPPASFAAVVRLVDGTGIRLGEFRDFGTAMGCAREAIEQFADANGSWPFYAGRFIRPDLIVSVDLVPAT